MKKKIKQRTGKLLLQIIPVTIGVFLGFLVTNWAENARTEDKAQIFRNTLVQEIQSNKQKIKTYIKYHEMLRDSARYYSNLAKIGNRPEFFRGLRIVALTNSAYETGLQTGVINELPFESILVVNNSYTLQNSYNEFSTMLSNGLLTKDFEVDEWQQFSRYLAIGMTDVVIKEKELITEYELLINELLPK